MKKIIYLSLSMLVLSSFNLMAQNWVVGGNNLSASGRLGTNNNHSLIFETNNGERGRVTNTGLWGFGVSSPSARLHINSASGQHPLKVEVNNSLKMFVHSGGGVSIGSSTSLVPPANGLLVAGNMGVGKEPGSYKFKITHSTFGFNIENATTLDDWEFWANSGGLSLYANGSFRGNFNPTTGVYTSVSDERVKANVQAMPTVLDKIKALKAFTYQFEGTNEKKNSTASYGFMAQDVTEVFPHLVNHVVDEERGIDTYTLDYSGFGVLAIKAIQELQQHILILESQIAALEEAQGKDKKSNAYGNTGNIGVWLEKNYPNPFAQSTIIGYSTPEQAEKVDLVITNLHGIEIQRFDHLDVGAGQVEIIVGSIPEGTYIYTLVVDGKPISSKKMLLSR